MIKNTVRVLVALLCLAGLAHAGNNHGLGSGQREMQAWFSDGLGGYVATGCAPAVPSSSLTIAAFACTGYVRDTGTGELIYVTQAANALTIADATPTWLAIHRDRSTSVSGWTRQAATHYIYKQNATQPATPSGALIFARVTVAAAVISAILPVYDSNPLRTSWVNVTDPAFGAIPDDGVDDTAAINLAIAAVRETGVIFFPYGEYVTTGLVPTRTINFVGASGRTEPEETTPLGVVLHSTTDAVILDFSSTLSAGSGVFDIGIEGSGNAAHTTQDGILIKNNQLLLHNVNVFNTGGDCIEVGHMNQSHWSNIKLQNCKGHGLNINQTTAIGDNWIYGMLIDSIAEAGTDGISCTAGGAFHIFGLVFGVLDSGGFNIDLANCDDNKIYGYHDETPTSGQSFNFGATAERNYVQASSYNGTLTDAGADNQVCGYDNNLLVGHYQYCRGKDIRVSIQDMDGSGAILHLQSESAVANIKLGAVTALTIGSGTDDEFVVNEGGADRDFRVETDGASSALRIRADNETAEWGVTNLAHSLAFASLPTPANAMFLYCSDCQVTSGADNTCTSGGTGAFAFRVNAVWRCFDAQN